MYVLLLAILFSSFAHANLLEHIEQRWQGSRSIEINPRLTPGETIKKPAAVHLKILEVTIYGKDFGLIKDCLFYRVPSKDKSGLLYLHSVYKQEDCDSQITLPAKMQKNEIYNLGIENFSGGVLLQIDTKEIPIISRSKTPSLLISLVEESGHQPYVKLCYQVDDQCRVVQKDLCEFCPQGAYPVITSACRSAYSKVCARETCGEKNGFACIRGYQATQYRENYCVSDSPVAYCKGGLRVFCENDKLICK